MTDYNLVEALEIGKQDVKLYDSNGKVLYAENANQQDDKNEVICPNSSLQVK